MILFIQVLLYTLIVLSFVRLSVNYGEYLKIEN